MALTRQLKLLTYNIHCGIGRDGGHSLSRIEQVLRTEGPDIAALQELDSGLHRTAREDQASILAERLGLNSLYCATRMIEQGAFGMAVLSRFTVLHKREYDLSYHPRREPRYCFRVDVEVEPGAPLHVFNCHLGLATRERRYQRRQMLSEAVLLAEDLRHPVVLMGDFNDRPIPVVHRGLRRHFTDAYKASGKIWGPTFKVGPFPIRLDHIYVGPGIRVLDCWVKSDGLAGVASDHRPVVAIVEVSWPMLHAPEPQP